MRPERVATIVRWWVQMYTRGLPAAVAGERMAELESDLHDHIEHERAHGTSDSRIARGIASRMVRGAVADASWRSAQQWAVAEHGSPEERVRARRSAYRRGLGTALGAVLVLYWMVGAVGIIGTEGDNADRMYACVLATGALGAVVSRLRPTGMARTLMAMAVVTASVAVIALVGGMVPDYNTPLEIVALNAFFVLLFAGSSRYFRRASLRRPQPDR